jgi:DNA-binding winged helix-turn-helix (wHTH) protein/tetratricopeptide (TPR) repeat protein
MYRFPPYSLDPIDQSLLRQLSGRDERIHLPPKAFAVLRFLVENAGRLVPHNELMDKVWPDTFVQPEVLSSHIRDIRAALGDSARRPRFIETVSRRGYRFIASIDQNASTLTPHTLPSSGQGLVGRDYALAKLHQCYRAALTGARQLVFVTGEPGIGKTALCREFLRQVRSADSPYATWGQCIEGYGVQEPYFPLLKAIGDLCRAEGAPIIEIFKAKAPTCIVQFSDLISRDERAALDTDVRSATSGRMLREVLDALEAVGESRPLVVILDDLQWVDRASVDVIAEFARRHSPAKLLFIGTFRPLEAFLNENPIVVLKEELLAHRLCTEVSLSGLTMSDIGEFLSQMTSQQELRSGLANLLYSRSEGNPLFMVAALEHSLEKGLLVIEDGELRLSTALDQLDLDIPLSLKRVLEVQIDNLETEERRILEVGSVEGVIFCPAVIAAATDHSYQEVEDICHDLAMRNQLLRAMPEHPLPDGSTALCYQFVHVLYRDVLYDRQSPGRRSARHLQIGLQLEEIHQDHLEEVAAEISLHFEQGCDWERTVRYLRLAAENSERRYAHREAIALLTRALVLVARVTKDDRCKLELEIRERLATIYIACFDPRCVEAYQALYKRANSCGQIEVSARALLNLASCLLTQDGNSCIETARHAAEIISTLPKTVMRTRMEMTCKFIFICAAGWDAAQAAQLRQTFHDLRQQVNAQELAPQTIQYGIIQWASSRYLEAVDCLVEGLEALDSRIGGGDPYLSIDLQRAYFYLPRALLFGGRWGEGLSVLSGSIATAINNRDAFTAKIQELNRVWIHYHAMDFDEVIAICEPLQEASDEFSGPYVARMARILLGSAYVGSGDLARATLPLTRVKNEMSAGAVVLDCYFRLPLLAALTELLLAKGDFEEATIEADHFVTLAQTTEKHTYSALAFEVSARVALARSDFANAVTFISQAVELINEYDLPLASWRVHATAAEAYRLLGKKAASRTHRDAANLAITKLADSIGQEHALRTKFLASSDVSNLWRSDTNFSEELATVR